MAFHRFGHLPAEIRLEIWRECLPNRVVELDSPLAEAFAFDPASSCYCCQAYHTAAINRLPPVISRVCRESRMVALEHVNLLTQDTLHERDDSPLFGTSMGLKDWVDKHRDVLHIHYWSVYDAYYHEPTSDPLDFWFSEARKRARGASLNPELFLDSLEDPRHLDIFRHQSLFVCLRIVSIHAPLRPALDSGLFGLLGDARVVLVDATDAERKERYRAFWEAHAIGPAADPHPARVFAESCQDDAWVREQIGEYEVAWMMDQWHHGKAQGQIANAESVWSKMPTAPNNNSVDWAQNWRNYVPNRGHEWVKDALEAMPKLRPMIMFRLCTHNCPEKAKLPVLSGSEVQEGTVCVA
jgi:hypothetical protein